MSDHILVTGASGFVGSAVARTLIHKGFEVRALCRATSSRANLAGLDCEIAVGDVRNPEDVNSAMKNVRYLFHVAADYRLWAPDPEEIVRNNATGTRAIMEAALAHGVEKIVYTSSVATLKPIPYAVADERSRHSEMTAIGAYKRSKVGAERLVERMIAEQGLPAVIVNPSTPIGPRDIKPTPTGRIIVEAMRGRVPAFVDTGLNLVHVDDVAVGHLRALECGRVGEPYILGGQDASLKEMLVTIADQLGRKPPRIRLPRTPLYPLAFAAEVMARLSGKEPFLTTDSLRMAKHHMFFSSAKAERELGYRARPCAEALTDAVAWFRSEGYA